MRERSERTNDVENRLIDMVHGKEEVACLQIRYIYMRMVRVGDLIWNGKGCDLLNWLLFLLIFPVLNGFGMEMEWMFCNGKIYM